MVGWRARTPEYPNLENNNKKKNRRGRGGGGWELNWGRLGFQQGIDGSGARKEIIQ